MSRWYPCRISCKPSQGPPTRGTCPPKRPVERLVQSYAENYSAISWKYSGKYPCLPGKAVPNREPTSVGAGHKNRSFSKTAANGLSMLVSLRHDPFIIFSAKTPLRALYGRSGASQCSFSPFILAFSDSSRDAGGTSCLCRGIPVPSLSVSPKRHGWRFKGLFFSS